MAVDDKSHRWVAREAHNTELVVVDVDVDFDTMDILVVVDQQSAELCPWAQEQGEKDHQVRTCIQLIHLAMTKHMVAQVITHHSSIHSVVPRSFVLFFNFGPLFFPIRQTSECLRHHSLYAQLFSRSRC